MREPASVRVRDLGLAAALVTCGHEVRSTERDASGRTHFIFWDVNGLGRDTSAYWSDTLHVRARTFFDNTKMLKGRIYADE